MLSYSPALPTVAARAIAVAAIWMCVPAKGDEAVDFRAHIAPILVEHCLVCHGGDEVEGGYDLSTLAGLLRAGDSMLEPIVAGDPTTSELMQRLVTDNASELMPSGGPPLGAGQIDAIYQWIAAGAPLPDLDSSVRLVDVLEVVEDYPPPPAVYPRPIPVTAAAITGDETIVVGGYRELLLWPPGNSSAPHRIHGFGNSIASIQARNHWLAIAHGTPGQRGEVTVARLDAQELRERQVVFRSSDVPAAIAVSPNAEHLAIGTLTGELVVLDLPGVPATDTSDETEQVTPRAGVQQRLSLALHADAITAVAWSADSQELLTASRDRTARVIRLQDGQSTSNFTMHERAVHGICQIKAGPVTLDETGTLRLWPSGGRTARLERPRSSDAPLGLLRHQDTVLVPSSQAIRRLNVEQVEQEDGTDENGKPKKRRVPRWKTLPPLELSAPDPIVSVTVSDTGTVIAGTQAGHIYRWQADAPEGRPQPPLVALPQ